MIRREEVFKIGRLNKPYGVKGELSFAFTNDVFCRADCDYLVLLLDGIFVPFFIEDCRFHSGNTALEKFEGIDSAEKARQFTNTDVYFPVKYMSEEEQISSWDFFVDFAVKDIRHGDLGRIVRVDDSTMNVLFVIERDGIEILLPAHEEFIRALDKKTRTLTVEVPDGLLS